MITEYIIQNWALILVLLGFAISLISTVFLEKKIILRMYALIAQVLLLSVIVFFEFNIADVPEYRAVRTVLIALRYSATPFIIAQIIFTIVKRQRWYVFIPAIVLAIVDIISIPTGVVFSIDASEKMQRGPLGLLPYVVVGFYCALLILLMIRHSSKQVAERMPIIYFSFAFLSGLIMPFLIGKDYAQIFCTTIAIAVFVYYVFSILQVTKKDPLTGLLNRQAYYADISSEADEISALVSIDMNGLKTINDTQGHTAGDEAITTVAGCFLRAAKRKHNVYRIGGDEFVIICRKVSEESVVDLTKRIHEQVNATKYSCSVGYSYSADGKKSVDELLSESDANMYAEKQTYYKEKKNVGSR